MTGAKIVECDAAAGISQGVDEPGALLNIIECRSLGDFHHQATGELGPIAQPGEQRAQPYPVASGQSRHVEAHPYLGMRAELPHRFFQDEAIDEADQTAMLDRLDELCARKDVPRLVTHPQQALEIIDCSSRRADHWLIRKQQAVL